MPRLAQLQRDFLAALASGDDGHAAQMVLPGNTSAARRLAVYRHNVRSNWRGALRAAYPVVAALVGEAFFDEAADRFAEAEPSRSGDLHRFGPGFAAFLGAYPHAAGLAYLPDVARLEWAWHESFHAAEHDRLDFAALSAVPPDRYGELRFGLHPSARLVRSDHPVLSIWQAHQEGSERVPRVDLDARGERVLVFRGDLDTRVFALDEPGWEFLSSLARGDTLDETGACLTAAGHEDAFGESLRRWAGEGVVVSFSLVRDGRQA